MKQASYRELILAPAAFANVGFEIQMRKFRMGLYRTYPHRNFALDAVRFFKERGFARVF